MPTDPAEYVDVCPKCHNDFDTRSGCKMCEADDLRREVQEQHDLIWRQAELLTGVVNAIRGEPPELVWWSHHDAPELARKAMRAYRDSRNALSDIRAALDPNHPEAATAFRIATDALAVSELVVDD